MSTRERIVDVGLRLFNQRGYAATSMAEIAAAAGIAKGNVTYHFPTKYDIVVDCAKRARAQRIEHRSKPRPGPVADAYVAIVHGSMEQAREFRFLLRDQVQFRKSTKPRRPDREAAAEIELLRGLLQRMQVEGMMRQNPGANLAVLARSVWMVSRFWIEYLDQHEGLEGEASWADQERGIRHHLAVLTPNLTASARREFDGALVRLKAQLGMPIA